MINPPKLNSNRAFIVGGYSHVNPSDFTDHISFFDSISMLLQYRYRLNPHYALRDNEGRIANLPYEKQREKCYQGDIEIAAHAGFLVAELTYPSTGTGQELQAAADNNIPVVSMIRGKEGKRVDVVLRMRNHASDVEEYTLTRGEGGMSKMVDGNPAILSRIVYNDYSDALRKLDRVLQKDLGLTPETKRLERAAALEASAGNALKAAELRERASLLDKLLEFNPTENTPAKYEKLFPYIRRLPLGDIEDALKPKPANQKKIKQ